VGQFEAKYEVERWRWRSCNKVEQTDDDPHDSNHRRLRQELLHELPSLVGAAECDSTDALKQ